VVICLERGADLHMAQLMPLPLTVSCSSKIQIGFTFLVPAHPGCPGQGAVKRVCVCVCVCVYILRYAPFDSVDGVGSAVCSRQQATQHIGNVVFTTASIAAPTNLRQPSPAEPYNYST